VKPTTGGGVILGGLCSREAGLTAVKALEEDDVTENSLRRYDAAWKQKYQLEFNNMQKVRWLIDSLSDESLNRGLHALKEENMDSLISELVQQGDMDLQGDIIKKALSNPRLFAVLLKVAGRYALSGLGDLVNI
jgi:flavin-dependent dehydrogenase